MKIVKKNKKKRGKTKIKQSIKEKKNQYEKEINLNSPVWQPEMMLMTKIAPPIIQHLERILNGQSRNNENMPQIFIAIKNALQGSLILKKLKYIK